MSSQWLGIEAIDVAVSAAVAGIAVASALADRSGSGAPSIAVGAWVLIGVQCAPLIARRRHALVVALVVGVGRVWYDLARYGSAPLPLGPLVAVYSVVVYGNRLSQRVLLPCVVVGLTVGISTNRSSQRTVNFVLNGGLLAVAAIIGVLMRQRRERIVEITEQLRAAERDRERLAREAVLEERDRIARELHDVVAHHVSLIAVQSEAAKILIERDPARAAEAVEAIGVQARQAMAELHELLGVLRAEPAAGASPEEPAAGLRDVGRFVDQFAAGGLAVDVHVDGEPQQVPIIVDLAAYRIVQEALTNTLRHAGATHASVDVRWRAHDVVVEVTDDGSATDGAALFEGHGLTGMRERAALCGGSLETEAVPGGGFRVRACLPVGVR
jgi:signal transduction histidine kinase